MCTRQPPTWTSGAILDDKSTDQLHLFNSFTKKKELFKPLNGKLIKWYSCGPTVYDESHMGHARCYISFDILRRVLQNYFNYDIIYCMNITDIDDKIIIKARQEYLFAEYVKENTTHESLVNDLKTSLKLIESKFQNEADKDKKEMYRKLVNRINAQLNAQDANRDVNALKNEFKDVLSIWLDKEKGKLVNENEIFFDLPKRFETSYHNDMSALNILPPTVLTRVTEYVPEIVEFIQKIIANGFAYESNGSVYFNTVEFDKSPNHYYAKLIPEAFGDSQALAEGEGALSGDTTTEKKNASDFALWKTSKAGEPSWDSPWGKGRPGWHIECSVMASCIFGPNMDIHSGGQDLKFPHHDNEIAQAEAAFGHSSWVNFFLHTGHLHIEGCKMSKSLKNFITIKDALKKYTARQIRILFLLCLWQDTLDYSDQAMTMAISFEKKFNEFFLSLKDYLRDKKLSDTKQLKKWTNQELQLNERYHAKRAEIHEALCDSINTPKAMKELSELITEANLYMKDNAAANLNPVLLREIGLYCTNLLRVFGLFDGSDSSIGFQSASEVVNLEETLMPYLNVLSKFRDEIRTEARLNKQIPILKLTDELRDNVLPELGVRLEDRNNERTVVKLCDKETLLKEREQKLMLEDKKRKKEEELREQKRLKELQMSIPPEKLFINETDKYSKFDEAGFPQLDKEGKELSKSAIKNLQKQYSKQKELYETHLKNKMAAASITEDNKSAAATTNGTD